jgi:hypothetical protein
MHTVTYSQQVKLYETVEFPRRVEVRQAAVWKNNCQIFITTWRRYRSFAGSFSFFKIGRYWKLHPISQISEFFFGYRYFEIYSSAWATPSPHRMIRVGEWRFRVASKSQTDSLSVLPEGGCGVGVCEGTCARGGGCAASRRRQRASSVLMAASASSIRCDVVHLHIITITLLSMGPETWNKPILFF